MEMIFAFGSVPKDGGTFTFYRNIRPVLMQLGIDMRCVTIGKSQANLWDEAYADDGCVLLAPKTKSVKKQAYEFEKWCTREGVDVVMGINSEAILSSIPHLPENIRVMSRCANAFDHGYKITLSGVERLAAIVAITPKLKDDLICDYAAPPSKLHLIPNGIDPEPFKYVAKRRRGTDDILQLGFLGRLEDNQKGVFHLPKIVKELNRDNVRFKLTIAGKGKHRSIIEREMNDEIQKGQVEFVGALAPEKVPDFLGSLDIFIFTSHFEGCPNALLEALMAGCVPIVWKIKGITDFIIDEGRTGFNLPVSDYRLLVKKIKSLDNDRERLNNMSRAASKDARDRFTNSIAATAYAELLKNVMNMPPPKWTVKAWNEFEPDENFPHTWRDWVPDLIKSIVKNAVGKID